MSVPLLRRKCNRFDYIYRSSYKPIATKRSGSRNQPKRCLRAGPEHAISYTWQLASNVAIVYPDSRFFVHLNQSESENEANFAILILYGRVLRNFFISSITCASFER